MARLIEDAAKLDDSVDANSMSFGNIVKAIHAVQVEMGIYGTTALEADKTISGSFNSMKAAASNFMTSLVSDNGDVKGSFEILKETALTFFDNVKPRVLEFLQAISPIATIVAGITSAFVAFKTAATISSLLSTLIKSWQAYKLANEGATIAQWLLNVAMNANPILLIVTLIAGLVGAIITLWNTNDDFKNALISAWEWIKDAATSIFNGVAKFFTETIPKAFWSVVDWFLGIRQKFVDIGKNIINGIWDGLKKAWESVKKWFSDAWSGIKNIFGFGDDDVELNAKLNTDGSHRAGLSYVPYDGYIAELHKGERVLTASEAKGYGGTSFGVVNINIDGANIQDDAALADMVAERLQRMTERRGAVFA